MRILSLFLIAVPLAEIIAFGLAVQWLGFWTALMLVVMTSVLGFLILRHQGFGMAAQMARMARTGMPPDQGIGSSVLTMVAGALLLVPGFITDIIGLALLVPFIRRAVAGSPVVRTRFRSAGTTTYEETYSYNAPPGRGETVVDLDEEEFRRESKGGSEDSNDRQRLGPR